MVGVENLYKGRIGFTVGIDDTAIAFVMVAAQQDIYFLNEFFQLSGIKRMGRYRFADTVHIPTGIGTGTQCVPEGVELRPLHDASKGTTESYVKCRFLMALGLGPRLTAREVKQIAHGDHRLCKYAYYAAVMGCAAIFDFGP